MGVEGDSTSLPNDRAQARLDVVGERDLEPQGLPRLAHTTLLHKTPNSVPSEPGAAQAEAEEWKQFRESPDPFKERIANRSSDLAESNTA